MTQKVIKMLSKIISGMNFGTVTIRVHNGRIDRIEYCHMVRLDREE
jgi:hypothetical protein